MAPDDIRFDSLREDCGSYFVEYCPPLPGHRFSILQLSIIDPQSSETVARAMETEAQRWLARHPVPLMATAFSPDGSVISLEDVRPISHLMAWIASGEQQPVLRWALVENEDLPDIALNHERLTEIFKSVPSKTGREVEDEFAKQVLTRKVGWWLVFLWAVVVPLIVAVVEWWSDLLGLLVLGYALVKAAIGVLRLTGRLPKSRRQSEKEANELRMRHHHYHCERNPDAFERLKAENFKREEIERTTAEATALKVPSDRTT